MNFIQHFSGSKGNFYEVVADSGQRLLIDPGVTWKKILKSLSYDLEDIAGCLLSHSHFDHSKGAKDLIAAGINVYSSAGTLEALRLKRGKEVKPRKPVNIGEFAVWPFMTFHDAIDPLGFLVVADKQTLFFATDTSHLMQKFTNAFDIIAIECAYNKEILQEKVDTQQIDITLAKRLWSSHHEESTCLLYLKEYMNLSRCRELHLLHLSKGTISKTRLINNFEKELFLRPIAL